MEHGLDRSGVMSKYPTGNGRFRSHPYRKKGTVQPKVATTLLLQVISD
jgi:hypothetical protein